MITNVTPQRALRGHMPKRPTPRAAATGAHHADLAGRLTSRDRWLVRMLHEHRVLTTPQIVDLCFPSLRAANYRLLELYKARVVDRFQPFIQMGTAPMHYVLDVAGAVVLAYEDGLDPRQVGYRHEDAIGIAHALRLAHTVGVNGVFASLVRRSQQPGAPGALTAWWSERRCARYFGDLVRPDAYGRWRENGAEVEFFVEFDFGTETLGVLSSKLRGYEKLATATGITTPVLVWFQTNQRQSAARNALATAVSELDRPGLVPVATSANQYPIGIGDDSPAGLRWMPIGPPAMSRALCTLADLGRLWPYTDIGREPSGVPIGAAPALVELAPPAPLPPDPPLSPFRRNR
jgi:hypothetical protein